MLTSLSFIVIGAAFWNLATKHGKSDWGYSAVGLLIYIGCIYLGTLLPYIITVRLFTLSISLIGMLIGLLACSITYWLLKRSWSRRREIPNDTLDAGLIDQEHADQ